MPYQLTLTPAASASTNPFGITFGTTAEVEFKETPEKILNKNLTGVSLDGINEAGIVVSKGPLNAIIPWSNIRALIYS